MPDILSQALATPGLLWVVAAAFVAGVVRGFAGFGTAMVFLPVASQVLSPITAVLVLLVMDLFGPLPAIPRAIRDGHLRDLARLVTGTVIALPLGIWVLLAVEPQDFKLMVSALTLLVVALLVAGVKYRGPMTPKIVFGTGAVAGFFGGAVALPGPPVVLLYMASPHPPQVIRANNTMFLLSYDILMLIGLLISGAFTVAATVLGAIMTAPYLAGNIVGGWVFHPDRQALYRVVAFSIILASALSGLWSVLAG